MSEPYKRPKRVRLPKHLEIAKGAPPLVRRVAMAIARTPQYLQLKRELMPYVQKRIIPVYQADAVLARFISEGLPVFSGALIAKGFINAIKKDSPVVHLNTRFEIEDMETKTRVTVKTGVRKLRILVDQNAKGAGGAKSENSDGFRDI